ncbi:hypothetical protein MQ089_10695 [Edwardsiella anguillarum]|uniref:hypothetical protein n=1 Tax=Edwardsiella anguillarum TaxID=1821960 RepID=UPI0024B6CDE7|nr:hypothetical protein [Edwardsiella anguillarum]EKS7780432.1 hypothetical protein [Edwardsiella piscicida]WHQ16392.1 hypothetical protein MQ085_10705 [Edwardsiella anguillarum]WHQ19925.1 hypothetical protein MQ089_10695 [Edwardsiella anguillarum]WHQ23447.1 hypothetical protein MQ094_10710 [Edwardsiella anguillarum]WHQ27020.1 hypothetical protein MQ093_10925 [Edwardsiella anguillarum]
MSVSDAYTTIVEGFSFINEIISEANEKFSSDGEKKKKDFIIESAFLKMFIFWETFVEDSFLCYLTDKTDGIENKPITYAKANDDRHAATMIIGQGNFVNWSNHEAILKMSKAFFKDGVPFHDSFRSIQNTLSDLRRIRNNTAHVSSSTKIEFIRVVTRTFNGSHKYDDISVADFLMKEHPEDKSKTILQVYQDSLLAVAHIVSTCEGV